MNGLRATCKRVTGWFRASLLPRFVLSMALAGLLFILVTFLFIRLYYNPAMTESVQRVESDYLRMQAENMRTYMRACRDVVYQSVIDQNLMKYARIYQRSAVADRAFAIRQINELMRKVLREREDTVASTIYMPDGSYVHYSRLKDKTVGHGWFGRTIYDNYDSELKSLCARAMALNTMQVGIAPKDDESTAMRLFHLAYPLRDLYSHKQYGVVVLSFNADTLNEMTDPSKGNGGAESASYGLLLSRENVVLAHSDIAVVGTMLSEEEGPGKFALTGDLVAMRQPVGVLGLTMMRVLDRKVLLADADRNTRRMALALIGITVLFVLAVSGMVQRIIRSIRRLRSGLEAVEAGDLNTVVTTRQVNEIGQIVGSFNAMTTRMRQVSAERERENRRAIEALNHLRAAEIRALENQINSHFLYNTLGTISYTATHAGNFDVSAQIAHLSRMLRYTFEKSNGIVPVEEEARWLGDYLALQRLRYGEMIDYRIKVDPEVNGWPIHKLILQPFVENSLLHGFEGRTWGCLLDVRVAAFDQDRLRVTLRDNGRGLSGEQLNRIRRCFGGNAEENLGEGIGLENASLRIQSYYRGQAKVILRGWPGTGTVVTLLLPRATDDLPGMP